MSIGLLIIAGLFFPIISFIAAIYFFLAGEMTAAFIFFIWWLIWAE